MCGRNLAACDASCMSGLGVFGLECTLSTPEIASIPNLQGQPADARLGGARSQGGGPSPWGSFAESVMRRVRGAAPPPSNRPTPQQRSPLAPRGGGGGGSVELAGAGGRLDSAQDLERAALAESAVRLAAARV